MGEKPQRIEICLGPWLRKECANNLTIEDKVRHQLKEVAGTTISLIKGSRYSLFDYALEQIDKSTAEKLVLTINKLEGYVAKSIDWI